MVQGKARSRVALPTVAVGVLAVSAAAILIRLSEAPALAGLFLLLRGRRIPAEPVS